jgi:hypothetical protein
VYLAIHFFYDKNAVGFKHRHWCQLCIGSQSGRYTFSYSFFNEKAGMEGNEIIRMVKERKWTKFEIKKQSIDPKI